MPRPTLQPTPDTIFFLCFSKSFHSIILNSNFIFSTSIFHFFSFIFSKDLLYQYFVTPKTCLSLESRKPSHTTAKRYTISNYLSSSFFFFSFSFLFFLSFSVFFKKLIHPFPAFYWDISSCIYTLSAVTSCCCMPDHYPYLQPDYHNPSNYITNTSITQHLQRPNPLSSPFSNNNKTKNEMLSQPMTNAFTK